MLELTGKPTQTDGMQYALSNFGEIGRWEVEPSKPAIYAHAIEPLEANVRNKVAFDPLLLLRECVSPGGHMKVDRSNDPRRCRAKRHNDAQPR